MSHLSTHRLLTKDSRTWIELYLTGGISEKILERIPIIQDDPHSKLLELIQSLLKKGIIVCAESIFAELKDKALLDAYLEIVQAIDWARLWRK